MYNIYMMFNTKSDLVCFPASDGMLEASLLPPMMG